MLGFDWDERKAEINLHKHRIDFSDAVVVFDDPLAQYTEDRSMYYGEVRYRIVGMMQGSLVTIFYAERGDELRLISARSASRLERASYFRSHRG